MQFNNHSNLAGFHAFLGASKWHWINYDEEKLISSYKNFKAVARGTELHELAANLIKLGVKLNDTNTTLNMYVNDAIGFNMIPEQTLVYSENCFGTADAICFRVNPDSKRGLLRIHDLKTGSTPAYMEQLFIYAALFCLEYDVRPSEIDFELRIYQSDEINISSPDAEVILPIMDKIITADKLISRIKEEERL